MKTDKAKGVDSQEDSQAVKANSDVINTDSIETVDKANFKCERCNFKTEDQHTFSEYNKEKHRIFAYTLLPLK